MGITALTPWADGNPRDRVGPASVPVFSHRRAQESRGVDVTPEALRGRNDRRLTLSFVTWVPNPPRPHTPPSLSGLASGDGPCRIEVVPGGPVTTGSGDPFLVRRRAHPFPHPRGVTRVPVTPRESPASQDSSSGTPGGRKGVVDRDAGPGPPKVLCPVRVGVTPETSGGAPGRD